MYGCSESFITGSQVLSPASRRAHSLYTPPQRRLVVAGGELGAHAKGVDGGTLIQQRLDGVLVQVVRDRDLHVRQALVVKAATHILGELGKVARVDTDGREALATRLHLARHGDGVLHTLAHVVGVNEQRAVVGACVGKRTEGLELRIEAHDPAVRMGAKHGDAVFAARKHV